MRNFFSALLLLLLQSVATAQIVRIEPASATADDQIKIIYDATQGTGGLVGASKVYMHGGVITSSPTATTWDENYVKGNWGKDDGIGLMTKVQGQNDLWEITLDAPARAYYGVPSTTTVFRLAMVFRNADGSAEGKGTPGSFEGGQVASNGDIFIDLAVDNFVTIKQPATTTHFIKSGEHITISAEASSTVSQMTIAIDQGQGFENKANVNTGTTISYNFSPSESFRGTLRVTATINGEQVQDEQPFNVNITDATTVAELPQGVQKGINYDDEDHSRVTLVLEAPGKDFVYVVGDMSNWEVQPEYLMNKTPDGELFWLTLTNLTGGKEYVFQYWVEGAIKVGDPYADKVADPWNDQYIPLSVNNQIPDYNLTENAIATTFQTGQAPYQWPATEQNWERPDAKDLVVYELLVRDFVGSRSYKDLIDTLDYIQNLGVNAIELMPVMEFEGNESWGYNPMYFFAPDKYYGTKNDLKDFIAACHQRGLAVILDMVLNHAFGLNPMVRMYWDGSKPSAESPWFNTEATHPFNVGYDFNHESPYTQAFVDSVNAYWLREYHFDGYRFDLSKGFTQTKNTDVGAWSAYDQSRVNLLKRMANKLWQVDEKAYVILEHFAASNEEDELAEAGMLLWRNMGYNYWTALGGEANSSFDGATAETHVSYMESHDEQRQLWEVYENGLANGVYNTRDTTIALERLKMNAAFLYTLPGPKMLWQFGELGYDIDINFNGRVGNKPLPWGQDGLQYYNDQLRKHVYNAFSAILNLRKQINAQDNVSYTYDFSGNERFIHADSDDLDVLIVGNYGLEASSINPSIATGSSWYNYFSGETIPAGAFEEGINLAPGEFRIYTSNKISDGFHQVVEAYELPVTISPASFFVEDEITITFDATKAHPAGTEGLVGAEKVYMHAGVVFEDFNATTLENEVGNHTDDGVGLMTRVDGENDMWQITLTPKDYFSITSGEAVKLGMYFRNADNSKLGKGFRGQTIFFAIEVDGELITITPQQFDQDTEITLTYDARFGNRGLLNAQQVYMHSGVITSSANGTSWDEQHVVGNWGADDGVGEMTRSTTNNNQWQITLTPSNYYGLGQTKLAYRLAFVFRNADGSRKGTGTAGDFEHGVVLENGDILYDVPVLKQITGLEEELPGFRYYPNPASGIIHFDGEIPGQIKGLELRTLKGEVVVHQSVANNSLSPLDISELPNGLYLLRIITEQKGYTLKVLVSR
ncbi:alpha-amylase family glycosyl hydrolase [Roseivirga thermotolerans]|uniref:DUF4961 domain-containing protein n=1 Tax=Roseivirga thermotolerans TaxID=1758176 RepID=UPI00273EB05D|nr:DUF4961 domain-containing protein [Roseivirga thermotolerans]